MTETSLLPVLTLKESVLFPLALMPVSIGRPQSIAAVEAALATPEKVVAVFTQRDAEAEDPELPQIYPVGTKAVIRRMGRSADMIQALLQGTDRIELSAIDRSVGYMRGTVRSLPAPTDNGTEVEALKRELVELATTIQELTQTEPRIDFSEILSQVDEPIQLVYLLASMAGPPTEKAQAILSATTTLEAMRVLHEHLVNEKQVAEVRNKIGKQARSEINKEQREYLLRQQLRAIQDELGEGSPEKAEVAQLRKRLNELNLPHDVHREAERELSRLESTSAAAPDFQVTRGHLDLILELPWTAVTTDNLDLAAARQVLDADHYGLTDIKERILEHLAVMKLNPGKRADPGFRRSARSWQDVAGTVDRAGARPQVRADELGRSARRSRASRPSSYLCRRDAGTPSAGHSSRGSEESGPDDG